jgi:hypothetical protein
VNANCHYSKAFEGIADRLLQPRLFVSLLSNRNLLEMPRLDSMFRFVTPGGTVLSKYTFIRLLRCLVYDATNCKPHTGELTWHTYQRQRDRYQQTQPTNQKAALVSYFPALCITTAHKAERLRSQLQRLSNTLSQRLYCRSLFQSLAFYLFADYTRSS